MARTQADEDPAAAPYVNEGRVPPQPGKTGAGAAFTASGTGRAGAGR